MGQAPPEPARPLGRQHRHPRHPQPRCRPRDGPELQPPAADSRTRTHLAAAAKARAGGRALTRAGPRRWASPGRTRPRTGASAVRGTEQESPQTSGPDPLTPPKHRPPGHTGPPRPREKPPPAGAEEPVGAPRQRTAGPSKPPDLSTGSGRRAPPF